MPLFTYECEKCGHIQEEFARASDTAKRACPGCKTPTMTRRLGSFAVSTGGGGSEACSTGTCPTGTCPFAN